VFFFRFRDNGKFAAAGGGGGGRTLIPTLELLQANHLARTPRRFECTAAQYQT